VQNNSGKLDELRARRAAEEKERRTREKEKTEARKRKEDMSELMDARAKQAEDKVRRGVLEKAKVADEIANNHQYIRSMEEREHREAAEKEKKTNKFRDELLKQIEREQASKREQAKNHGLTSGPNLRDELIKECAKLEVIREKMISDLMEQGVESRYLSELRNVNIEKIVKR
jgi:hypothetical protein